MAAAFEHVIESAVRGFHVYKDTWTPVLHEDLRTRQELGNTEDRYAVAVVKEAPLSSDGITVGHVPREISRTCWFFLQHDGEIRCTITGSKRRSTLSQGGLEIPCQYKFIGKKRHIKKLKALLKTKEF